jgi:uridine kinase
MPAELSAARTSTIVVVAARIVSIHMAHPVRVAVDGRTGSGKTTFADEVACTISAVGKNVVRASVDGFHHLAKVRYRQGRHSPDGYFEDARDWRLSADYCLIRSGQVAMTGRTCRS